MGHITPTDELTQHLIYESPNSGERGEVQPNPAGKEMPWVQKVNLDDPDIKAWVDELIEANLIDTTENVLMSKKIKQLVAISEELNLEWDKADRNRPKKVMVQRIMKKAVEANEETEEA